MRSMPLFSTIIAACAALGGCAKGEGAIEIARETDPLLTSALGEAISIDPDLAAMNRANSAASLPPHGGILPTLDSGPEFAAAARAEAVALVGGPGQMRPAPEPGTAAPPVPPAARLTAATLAAASLDGADECAERARYTMQWAARLPESFPVYPRAAVQEAAGTDVEDCSLRAVRFVTPVPLGDVIDFYFTLASSAGYSTTRTRQNGEERLAGEKGKAAFTLYARRIRSGKTEVDLITAG